MKQAVLFCAICLLVGLHFPQHVSAYFTATATGVTQLHMGDWQAPQMVVAAPLGTIHDFIDQTTLSEQSGTSVTIELRKPADLSELPETTLLYLQYSVEIPEPILLTAQLTSASSVLAEVAVGTTNGEHTLIVPLSKAFLEQTGQSIVPLTLSLDTSILATATLQLYAASTAVLGTNSEEHTMAPSIAVVDQSATEVTCSDAQDTAVNVEQETPAFYRIVTQDEGLFQLRCTTTDEVGNSTTRSFSYSLDTTAPPTPVAKATVRESDNQIAITLAQDTVFTKYHHYRLTLIDGSGAVVEREQLALLPKDFTHLWLDDAVLFVFSTDGTAAATAKLSVTDAFGNGVSVPLASF